MIEVMEPLHINEGDLAKDIRSILQRVETGAEMLVSACPTCEMVLKNAAAAAEGRPIVVKDLNDLLWKALKKSGKDE